MIKLIKVNYIIMMHSMDNELKLSKIIINLIFNLADYEIYFKKF